MLKAPPHRRSQVRLPGRKLLALTSLGLAGVLAGLLSGCSDASRAAAAAVTQTSATNFSAVAGNWRFASGDVAAPVELSGALAVAGKAVSGRLHALPGTCAPTAGASFAAAGTISEDGTLSLAGEDALGHGFAIEGRLAADQHSLVDPTVTVSGSCLFSPRAESVQPRDGSGSTGQQYQPVAGNYAGTFTDSDGDSIPVSATLSQPTTPDANGVYHLTGTGNFTSVPCLNAPVVTDSTVSGNQLSATYTDSTSGATVTGNGTFSADAQTLTISSWTLSSTCGSASGSGILNHQ